MMIGMTVCSGIGAPEYASSWINWRYQSEIDKFASEVLKSRFPTAINLGNMIEYKDWPDDTVDILFGGTPCQSFSLAGNRKGLQDERGKLTQTFLSIADKYRPKWIVWENVASALTSNKGRDFGMFLYRMGKLGYGFAYRVLDTQHVRSSNFPYAIPQRRRRVFVVGYLGDWRHSTKILYNSKSSIRRTKKSKEERKNPAALTANGVGTCGADDNQAQAGHLIPRMYRTAGDDNVFDEGFVSAPLTTQSDPSSHIVQTSMGVRRFTPIECERLMGFPDNWTNVREKCPLTPRYKALGNSISVNSAEFILDNIRLTEGSM